MPIHVYSPEPPESDAQDALAPRLDSLSGRRIGFVGNLKPNCDVLLHRTADLMTERLGVSGIVYREKSSCSVGAPGPMLDEVASMSDAAVVALGD